MKKNLLILPAIVILVIAVTFSSCSLNIKTFSERQTSALVESIDKVDYALLDYAPEVKAIVNEHVTNDQQAASLKAFAADMIAKAKANDPLFYASFVNNVNSDDPAVREQAIKDGVAKLTEQLKRFAGSEDVTMDQLFDKIFSKY